MKNNEKILLMLLPIWTPLIPPIGISCLNAALKKNNIDTQIIDVNIEPEFKNVFYSYCNILRAFIPRNKQGNFYNTAHHVIRNHFAAHIKSQKKSNYNDFVNHIIYEHYFVFLSDAQIEKLIIFANNYFMLLQNYIDMVIERFLPTIVGISVYSGTLPSSLFTLQVIKNKYPTIKTIIGGGIFAGDLAYDSTNFNNFVNNTPFIDHIIVGEGEILLDKVLNDELHKKKVYTIADINGTTMDLTQSNVPDFNGIDVDKYPQISMYASRSCPFQCSFCSETVLWGKYRKKKPTKIFDEMKNIYDRYHKQLFLLGDSLLNPIIDEMSQYAINEKLSFYWDGYLRADEHVCDYDNAMLWRRGGMYRARLGVESGSQKILGLMNKKITPEQIKRAVSSLANAGIKTTTYWVVGYPGETENDFQMTLDLISELHENIYEAECNPFQFFQKGQVGSENCFAQYPIKQLYPIEFNNLLITQTWIVDCEPDRKTIYDRICRFVRHCDELKIPNPYSLLQICSADKRWMRLHERAVPSLHKFSILKKFINENLYL
jgi:radical SAM superfamily enzyme YgiQ (UPF0313 family)